MILWSLVGMWALVSPSLGFVKPSLVIDAGGLEI